jgi:hypothetical protein
MILPRSPVELVLHALRDPIMTGGADPPRRTFYVGDRQEGRTGDGCDAATEMLRGLVGRIDKRRRPSLRPHLRCSFGEAQALTGCNPSNGRYSDRPGSRF